MDGASAAVSGASSRVHRASTTARRVSDMMRAPTIANRGHRDAIAAISVSAKHTNLSQRA